MTFLQEEEVFPAVTDSDASEKFKDSATLSVSADSSKEEANNTNMVADGKRKLSDKQADKKVLLLFLSCLNKWLHPPHFSYIWCFDLEMGSSFGSQSPTDLVLFQEANKPPDSWFELKINTHVYVTGLPEDVTTDEVSLHFFLNFPESSSCCKK